MIMTEELWAVLIFYFIMLLFGFKFQRSIMSVAGLTGIFMGFTLMATIGWFGIILIFFNLAIIAWAFFSRRK